MTTAPRTEAVTDGAKKQEAADLDAGELAERVTQRMGDLVQRVEVASDDLVTAEGIPDLVGEALAGLRDVVGLGELMCIAVVDRTDAAEGLELVHLLSSREGGPLMELWTPFPPFEEGTRPAIEPPSSTGLWRAANWQEREAWEMSGVPFEGHPGLRRLLLPPWWEGHPLRRDEARQRTLHLGTAAPAVLADQGPVDREDMADAWRSVALPAPSMGGGLDVRVRVRDGRVTKARLGVGRAHRGVEGLLERGPYTAALPLVARTCARSSVHWQVAYAEAVERLCKLEVPPRGRALRVALMELERIADHMLVHATMLELVGCRAAASRVWSDRELVMDVSQMATGQRLVQDAVSIGGVVRDAPDRWVDRLSRVSKMVQAAVHEYVEAGMDLVPLTRLEGLAKVHLEDMEEWGLTGPLLRAAGVGRDARSDGRCQAYIGLDVPTVTREAGDAEARMELRLLEISASARLLAGLARSMPGGRVAASAPELVPRGRSVGIVEDPRGETLCLLASDGSSKPRRVRLRSPDMAHAAAMGDLLIGCPLENVALAVVSVDLCAGGVDR